MNKIVIPYFDDYPETMEMYCVSCMTDPKCIKKIRKDFEKDIRSFLKADKVIEGIENIDGEKIKCWYEYEDNSNLVYKSRQMEFVN